jgi:hypothetical protein
MKRRRRSTPQSRREFWSRDDVRLAGVAVALAIFGLEAVAAIIWVGLTLWQRDFKRRFSDWYKYWVLAGLVAVWLVKYPLSGLINVPPSWVGLVLSGGAAWIGIRYQPKRSPYKWR